MKKLVFLFGAFMFFLGSFNLNAKTTEISPLDACADSADHWIWVEIGIYGAFESLENYYDAWWWWYDACIDIPQR